VHQVGFHYTDKAACILQYVNFTSQLSINATVHCTFYDSGGLEMTIFGRHMLA